MSDRHTLFLFVTAAGRSRLANEFVHGALAAGWTIYTVATPNVANVIDPAALFDLPGNHWIHDYGEPPLDRFPFGTMLVAPCTFNTFNKLAHGLADNLATAMVADALGAGCPIFIAPSMNPGLWNHPLTRQSYDRLTSWGCSMIGPQISETQVTMVPVATILARLSQHFAAV
ncbi:MAG: flavoprotein [Herpetosiphonaceae bacterium]|nr:flavoprotein [Herpetosiphonaceae bacterium]